MINQKSRIMVVEDDLPLLYSIAFTIRRQGYQVTAAASGKAGLEQMLAAEREGRPFHLLVTDIVIPVIAGLELIDELNNHNLRIPMMVITAGADRAIFGHLSRRGIADVLVKPFNSEELVNRVFSILNRHSVRSQGGTVCK